jgi:YVTN family beta-propeller protein
MPWSVTISPNGKQLYVSMVGLRDRDNVWLYDAGTLKVQAKSQFDGHAVESRLVGEHLLVSNSRDHVLLALHPQTLKVVETYKTGVAPKGFDVSNNSERVFVANYVSGTLSAVELGKDQVEHVRTGRNSRGLILSPNGADAYVMNYGEGTVAVVDTSTLRVKKRIRACKKPRHAINVEDNLLVTCYGSKHVVVIDRTTHRVVKKLRVGLGPKTIALAPNGEFAVTANEKGNSISIIDLKSFAVQTKRLPARQPCGVAVAPNSARMYVTARGSHQLLELDAVE